MIIQADFTGADKKTAMLVKIPAATKRYLTKAGTEIVKRMKINVSRGILGGRAFRRTGQFARNIGMKVITTAEAKFELIAGTGVGTAKSVIYASVHEFGMVIRAKKAKYLHFRTADGRWHMVKQVTIPARHPLERSVGEVSWGRAHDEILAMAGGSEIWE